MRKKRPVIHVELETTATLVSGARETDLADLALIDLHTHLDSARASEPLSSERRHATELTGTVASLWRVG